MKLKRESIIIIITIIIIIIIAAIFIINENRKITGNNINGKSTQQNKIQITPLSPAEKQRIENTLISSEFIKDMPKNEIIDLRFFNFINREKIWQDNFLIGKNHLLSQGNPSIYLSLHSKYIPELTKDNLCEVIKKAKKNGDLGFYSEYSKPRLLIKYASMLKYRSCFGF